MEALWIGYDEAEQLRELLHGIAADEHAPEGLRSRSLAAAGRMRPSCDRRELETLAALLDVAAGSELDPTWREGAGYWHQQVQRWLRPGSGHGY
jgi:hypothetical protein